MHKTYTVYTLIGVIKKYTKKQRLHYTHILIKKGKYMHIAIYI